LWHDRDAGVSTRGERGGDLGGIAGAHDRSSVTVEPARPVDEVARHDFGVDEYVRLADDVDELALQLRIERWRGH
jgi:hypothetical protein